MIRRFGGSRLGGDPDLPTDASWPHGKNGPLSFVLQIDLSEVAGILPGEGLPEDGLLSFFYDAVQQPWGFDPADRGSWAVRHSPAQVELERRASPAGLSDDGIFEPLPVAVRGDVSFPSVSSPDVVALLGGWDESWDRYGPVLGDEDNRVSRLLGHPQPVQGEMQEECQLASNGIYCGDTKHLDDPAAQELVCGAGEWRLLAQLDSYDSMMWGDVGRLYFWIRDEDLRARNWDAVWLVLQCS